MHAAIGLLVLTSSIGMLVCIFSGGWDDEK